MAELFGRVVDAGVANSLEPPVERRRPGILMHRRRRRVAAGRRHAPRRRRRGGARVVRQRTRRRGVRHLTVDGVVDGVVVLGGDALRQSAVVGSDGVIGSGGDCRSPRCRRRHRIGVRISGGGGVIVMGRVHR